MRDRVGEWGGWGWRFTDGERETAGGERGGRIGRVMTILSALSVVCMCECEWRRAGTLQWGPTAGDAVAARLCSSTAEFICYTWSFFIHIEALGCFFFRRTFPSVHFSLYLCLFHIELVWMHSNCKKRKWKHRERREPCGQIAQTWLCGIGKYIYFSQLGKLSKYKYKNCFIYIVCFVLEGRFHCKSKHKGTEGMCALRPVFPWTGCSSGHTHTHWTRVACHWIQLGVWITFIMDDSAPHDICSVPMLEGSASRRQYGKSGLEGQGGRKLSNIPFTYHSGDVPNSVGYLRDPNSEEQKAKEGWTQYTSDFNFLSPHLNPGTHCRFYRSGT